jgi:hypothetical protein
MAAPVRLVLYGNSVFLAGLRAALSRYSTLEMITIESGHPGAAASIQAFSPRAVIFDRSGAQPDFALGFLCDRPNLLLIGVDTSSDEIAILTLHNEHVSSVTELVNVIKQHIT